MKKTFSILCAFVLLFCMNTFQASAPPVIIQNHMLSPESVNDIVSAFKDFREGFNLENFNAAMISVGSSIAEAMKPARNQALVGFAAAAGMVVVSGVAMRGINKYISKYLFEPSLIEKKRSSSWITEKILSPFLSKKPINLEDHMVISDQLSNDLHYLMNMTKNIKKNGGEFEHVLLHGQPGTGKTLFAQLLAEYCGMSYAFVPAANISQFLANGTAVQELNELFTWAEKNNNGTILFFDEAETFLADRSTLSNEAQNALSAFLAKTGTPSNKIMIICATNRPKVIDEAALSRLGLRIEFPLPDFQARQAQLVMHIKNTFGDQKGVQVDYACLQDKTYLNFIAQQLDGCSGRTIQKCINRFRQMALSEDILTITSENVDRVLGQIRAEKSFILN